MPRRGGLRRKEAGDGVAAHPRRPLQRACLFARGWVYDSLRLTRMRVRRFLFDGSLSFVSMGTDEPDNNVRNGSGSVFVLLFFLLRLLPLPPHSRLSHQHRNFLSDARLFHLRQQPLCSSPSVEIQH